MRRREFLGGLGGTAAAWLALSMRPIATFTIALMLTWVGVAPGHAEKRVALVIGNGTYTNAPRLANPRNDAEDVAAALKRIGFETMVAFDLDKAGMDDIEIRFARAARGAEVTFFYYSGHAVQFAGTNYLAPVDVKLTDEADLRRMVRVEEIVSDLRQARDLGILVLDACRDNPLVEDLKRSIGLTRALSLQRGLARMDTPQGMILSYATQPGRTAADGASRNSPYTAAFLKHIEDPTEIGTIFRQISADVYTTTKRKQLPELSLSLVGEFYLHGRPGPATQQQVEMAYWLSVKDSTSPVVLATYLQRYPNGEFAPVARALIEHYQQQIKLEQAARQEEEKHQEEARKAAEVKRLERRGEQAKDDTGAKRVEGLQPAELAAGAEELRKALEEVRVAREAAKEAEEQRLAAHKAAEKAKKEAEEAIATKRNAERKNKNAAKVAALPNVTTPTANQEPTTGAARCRAKTCSAARNGCMRRCSGVGNCSHCSRKFEHCMQTGTWIGPSCHFSGLARN
jgi:uncharacterized caspase-like protein